MALALALTAACSGTDTSDASPAVTAATGGQAPPENYAATVACTTVPQSGCPSDHTCQIATHSGDTTCVKAGESPVAGSCFASNDCALGLLCWNGMCRTYCNTADDCEGDVVACLQSIDGNGDEIVGQQYCTTPCNPADPQNLSGKPGLLSCPSDRGCFIEGAGAPSGTTNCVPAGHRGVGQSCDNDCEPGLVCVSYDDHTACSTLCLMGQGSCNCQSFSEPGYASIGGKIVEVGYCQ